MAKGKTEEHRREESERLTSATGEESNLLQPLVMQHKAEIEAICRRFHVRRLDVFGSATRNDFDPEHSDIDFLVEYEPDNPLGGLEAYFGLKDKLEALLGRPVDLVMPSAVRNPYLRDEIERSRKTLFTA
jgi:uncharacterized protein